MTKHRSNNSKKRKCIYALLFVIILIAIVIVGERKQSKDLKALATQAKVNNKETIRDAINITKNKSFLFFGDSITYGAGAVNRNKDGYVALLSSKIDMDCINKGIPTTTLSTSGKDRLEIDVIGNKPDYLLILYGTNDFGDKISVKSFQSTYEGMLQKIKKSLPNTKIFICSLTTRKDQNTIGNIQDYNNAIENIALNEKVHFIDTNKAITTDDLTDHVHPNNLGHQKLADYIYNEVSKYIVTE